MCSSSTRSLCWDLDGRAGCPPKEKVSLDAVCMVLDCYVRNVSRRLIMGVDCVNIISWAPSHCKLMFRVSFNQCLQATLLRPRLALCRLILLSGYKLGTYQKLKDFKSPAHSPPIINKRRILTVTNRLLELYLLLPEVIQTYWFYYGCYFE